MEPLQFLILALATWRAAWLLVREDGPGALAARARVWAGTLPIIGGAWTCVYCMSIWTALVMWVLWDVAPVIPILFAISGLGLMLASYAGVMR